MKQVTLSLALLLSTSLSGQELIEKSFTRIKQVNISLAQGKGILRMSDTDQTKLTFRHNYSSGYTPIIKDSLGTLVVREQFTDSNDQQPKGKADWVLEIPSGMTVDYDAISGSFFAEKVDANLTLDLIRGSIQIDQLNGNLQSEVVRGKMLISKVIGTVDAEVVSGGIKITDVKGDVKAGTASGKITVDQVLGGIELGTARGQIVATQMTLTGPSRVESATGNIRLQLAASLNHSLTMGTATSSVILDFQGHEPEGNFLISADKNKGRISAPFTFDKEYNEEHPSRKKGKVRVIEHKEAARGTKDIQVNLATATGNIVIKNKAR